MTVHLTCGSAGQPVAATTLASRGQAAAVQARRYNATPARKHYHQRMIQLRQRSPSLAEYAKGRLTWAAACQTSTASV
jgi:hypothetical protein